MLKTIFFILSAIAAFSVFTQEPMNKAEDMSRSVNLTSSNLPIFIINTNGQEIPDDPRIIADMGIIYNGPGQTNHITDPFNNYNGKISIEIRGKSSQDFPKKSYGFETQNLLGENNNVSSFAASLRRDRTLQPTDGASFFNPDRNISSPFGTRYGEVLAWNRLRGFVKDRVPSKVGTL